MRPPTTRRARGLFSSGGDSYTSSDKNRMLASSSSSTSGDPSYLQDDVVELCLAGGGGVGAAEEDSLAGGDVANSILALESLLGYKFRNPRLAEEALIHPSAHRDRSYERLEFLGDAALGLAVATHLFLTYPNEGPGRLSLLRAANVSTEKLARAALHHGLYDHLCRRTPHLDSLVEDFAAAVAREGDGDAELAAVYGGASVKAPKVLADVTESVAAAVFVDAGYNLGEMWRVCRGLLEPFVTAEMVHDQPVSVLNMLCQQRRWDLHFVYWGKDGRTVSNAFINGQLLGLGCSDQKHVAKLNAARDALRGLSRLLVPEAESAAKEAEKEKGMDGGSRGEKVARGEDIVVVSRAAVGGEAVEGLQDADETAGVICELTGPAGAGGSGSLEEEVEGAKTKLHTICGRNHWSKPVYRVVEELGPVHDRRFICSVRVETPGGSYEVSGRIKYRRKDAENAAASELIKGLLNGHVTKLNS